MSSSVTLFSYMQEAIDKINTVIVPFLFALAFIFYIYNIYSFFIQKGSDPKSIEKGREFAIWGIVGFFVMLSVWGLVNILINTFYLSSSSRPCLPTFGTSNGSNCGTTPAASNTNTSGSIDTYAFPDDSIQQTAPAGTAQTPIPFMNMNNSPKTFINQPQ